VITVSPPIEIATHAGTIRIEVDKDGKISLSVFQHEGQSKYELRVETHGNGKLIEVSP
jgi:hypothetical protein